MLAEMQAAGMEFEDRPFTLEEARAAREAGSSLALRFRQASATGVDLGVADCYRVVDDQVAMPEKQDSAAA